MVSATLLLGATTLDVRPFSAFDGKSWSGVRLGEPEREVRRRFRSAKTVIADPASFRLLADSPDVTVTALVTRQRGRGNVVGLAVEPEGRGYKPLTPLASLTEALGPEDATSYPALRSSDWRLAVWRSRGVAAVAHGPDVWKVLLTDPERLASRLGSWGGEPTAIYLYERVPVGGVSVSGFGFLGGSSDLSSTVRRFAGKGMVGDSRSGNLVSGSVSVTEHREEGEKDKKGRRKSDKVSYTVRASASLIALTPFGTIRESGSRSTEESGRLGLAWRADNLLDSAFRDLDRRVGAALERLRWHAEWRPFYALAR